MLWTAAQGQSAPLPRLLHQTKNGRFRIHYVIKKVPNQTIFISNHHGNNWKEIVSGVAKEITHRPEGLVYKSERTEYRTDRINS